MIRTPLYRQTPPAIFPVTLGFLGLGNAWINAASMIGFPVAVGQLLTGLATLFYVFFATSYILKFAVRPSVLHDDLTTAPNRAGLAALTISLMVLSLALQSLGILVAPILWVGVIGYIIVMILVARELRSDPPEARQFSPFQYLSFVALIVAAIPAFGFGYRMVSLGFALLSLVAFAIVTIGWGAKLIRVRPPLPLRPSVVMILAPLSLFAITFWLLGMTMLAVIFYAIATIIFLMFCALSVWLTKGGWTPVWGAFTFPIAAFANLQVMAVSKGIGPIATVGLFASLAIGTPLILYIAYKHTMAWSRGDLSKKTGAAVA